MKQSLSRAEARRIALAAQGFGRARGSPPAGTRQMNDAIRRMAVLQIDSVNVFARSHYMPLFARLGAYDTAVFDKLAFRSRSSYTEYWAHQASFIDVADRPLFGFRMHDMREGLTREGSWAQSHPQAIEAVRSELASRGPLRPAQFEQPARRAGTGWWDWNDVKQALEHLWLTGDVAIAGRRGFERVYGLAEDVLPAEALDRDIPKDIAMRELILRAARAYGVSTVADLDDYWRFRDQRRVGEIVAELEEAGELLPVQVEGWMRGGKPLAAWVHRDVRVPRSVDVAALLTPFDPMVWFRDRAERLFDFDYRIEIYTPAANVASGTTPCPSSSGTMWWHASISKPIAPPARCVSNPRGGSTRILSTPQNASRPNSAVRPCGKGWRTSPSRAGAPRSTILRRSCPRPHDMNERYERHSGKRVTPRGSRWAGRHPVCEPAAAATR